MGDNRGNREKVNGLDHRFHLKRANGNDNWTFKEYGPTGKPSLSLSRVAL